MPGNKATFLIEDSVVTDSDGPVRRTVLTIRSGSESSGALAFRRSGLFDARSVALLPVDGTTVTAEDR